MAATHGKLNPSLVVPLLATRVTINKTPTVSAVGVFLLSAVARTLTSLRYASAMMLLLNRRVLNKMRIQTRADKTVAAGIPHCNTSFIGMPNNSRSKKLPMKNDTGAINKTAMRSSYSRYRNVTRVPRLR